MSHVLIRSNLIGVPDVQIPLDDDLLLVFNASNGQLMLPVLFAQVMRDLKHVSQRIERIEGAVTPKSDCKRSPCSG
jgi:hypothetical protein